MIKIKERGDGMIFNNSPDKLHFIYDRNDSPISLHASGTPPLLLGKTSSK